MAYKKRLPAYILDMIIVTIIINLFGLCFPKWVELENKSQEEFTNIFIKDSNHGEELTDEYFETIMNKAAVTVQTYDKEIIIYKGLEIMILFGYFIIVPLCMNGQTIGKKLLKIKIINEDNKLTYKNLIIRTLLITDLGVLVLTSISVFILPAVPYFIFKDVLGIAELVLLIIGVVTIFKNEKHIGFHDKLAHTEVVESN